jgi:hypothetical protein
VVMTPRTTKPPGEPDYLAKGSGLRSVGLMQGDMREAAVIRCRIRPYINQ